jgi:hypothetical protein
MSSSDYSACVSRNLVRTSPVVYREQANFGAPSKVDDSRRIQLKLPLASFRPFPGFGPDGDGRVCVRTTRVPQ